MTVTSDVVSIPTKYLHNCDPSEFAVLTFSGDNLFPLYQDGDVLLIHKTKDCTCGEVVVLCESHYVIGRITRDFFSPLGESFPPTAEFHIVGVPVLLLREFE